MPSFIKKLFNLKGRAPSLMSVNLTDSRERKTPLRNFLSEPIQFRLNALIPIDLTSGNV